VADASGTSGQQEWLHRLHPPHACRAAESIRSFAIEMSARWYAVGLAKQVREVGITALRPADIPVRPPQRLE
jgi:hypothetical protein